MNKTDITFDGTTKTVAETTTYDALDNPLQTKIGGNLQTVDYEYFAGGFLDKINGGSTGAGGLSLTDNGWPSDNSNNDLFAMDLDYSANGNISNWKQQNRGFALQNYSYTYDALQRLTAATNGTQAQGYSYKDALGNFNTLTRTDLVKTNGNWTAQSIDNLAYSYTHSLSSKISSISDATNSPDGYKPNASTYAYDANGNTTYDPANKISSVYNYLNLPSKFTKDDNNRQEIFYDASGHKWQEKTYDASGNEIGKKTYLGPFEFEGNSLKILHHPQGYIENLAANLNVSGTATGNLTGANIISTQQITQGGTTEYKASNAICLLPGFESTPIFKAEITPSSGYQWNFILKDHLGSTRVVFADKNNDGLVKQSSDASENEVLSLTNYSPFGLELGGSHQNLSYQFDYKFNGKETDRFSTYIDYGGRWFDQNRGVWGQIDALAEKYFHSSSYSFTDNNPINRLDLSGNDWFRIADGSLQYDPKVQGQKDLQKGQKYIGDTFNEKTKRGSANYREDGSILYSNQTDAYNRIWNNSTVGQTHEESAAILENGVLVFPSYLNNSTTVDLEKSYGYKFVNGNLIDAADGKIKSLVALVHTHPDKKGSPSPSTYTAGGPTDVSFQATRIPGMMGFVFGHDNNLFGLVAFRNKEGRTGYQKYLSRDLNNAKVTNVLRDDKKINLRFIGSQFKYKPR